MALTRRCAVVAAAMMVLAGAGPSDAQTMGAKGGLVLSRVVFTEDFAETSDFAPGLSGGLFVRFGLPWALEFQVEGLLTDYRATIEDIQEDRLRYVEVPVLVRRRVPGASSDTRRVSLLGGVVARRLLSATETIGGESFDIADGVRSSDVALVVGGEVTLTSRWAADVRYLHGREGIFRRVGREHAGRHRTVQATVAYTFKR